MKFTETFYGYVGETQTIKVGKFEVTATIHHDGDHGAPWEEEDGHGEVSEWTARDKRPGERVLISDRQSKRFYDFAGAVELAKRDGWDTPPYGTGTKGERAARAAEADYRNLKAWADNEWYYVGIVLSVSCKGITLAEHGASLWGIESSAGDYLTETANDLLPEALRAAAAAKKALAAA